MGTHWGFVWACGEFLVEFFFCFQPPVKIFGDVVVWTLPFSPQAHTLSPLDMCAVVFISHWGSQDHWETAVAQWSHFFDYTEQMVSNESPLCPQAVFPLPWKWAGGGNVTSWKLTEIPLSQQNLFIWLFKKKKKILFFIEKGTLLTFRGSLVAPSWQSWAECERRAAWSPRRPARAHGGGRACCWHQWGPAGPASDSGWNQGLLISSFYFRGLRR